MSEYRIGKDIAELQLGLQRVQTLLQELYTIIEHNIKKENLEEPRGGVNK